MGTLILLKLMYKIALLIKGYYVSHNVLELSLCCFKKGDREVWKNWRPITLLNIDHKILTKCLANRLSHVIPSKIHNGQTCSVKGRSIFETISLIRDTVDFMNQIKKPGVLIIG